MAPKKVTTGKKVQPRKKNGRVRDIPHRKKELGAEQAREVKGGIIAAIAIPAVKNEAAFP